MKSKIIKKGTFILLSKGEYFSYEILGVLQAHVDLDIEIVRKKWEFAMANRSYKAPYIYFEDWLVDQQLCVNIPYVEWNVDDTTV